jgi:protocatechuate 3,4-dioxygenase beta subunit
MSLPLRSHRLLPHLLLVTLAGQVAASPRQLPINTAPPGPRTALVVGQVLDESGAPVPEAIVEFSMPRYAERAATTPRGRVMADRDGRFFFADLHAGEYWIRANKEGYAGGVFGMRRASGDYQLLTLAEGERRTDVKLTLWKYAVIAGTVVDEAGEPVVGVMVQALRRQFIGGRLWYGNFANTPYLVRTARTDDRGVFRISQLEPASYVVVVPSYLSTAPAAVLSSYAQDSHLLSELLSVTLPNGSDDWKAEMANTALGQARTLRAGDFGVISTNRVSIPPPATAAGRMEVYRTTFNPAATTANGARAIAVASGEERTNVDVTLRPVQALRVSGRLVNPDGTPALPTAIRLIGDSARDVGDAGFEAANGVSDARGRFVLAGVPPGNYVLKTAKTRFGLDVMRGLPSFWAAQRVAVGDKDVEDVLVALRPALRIEGRVEYRNASGLVPRPDTMRGRILFFQTAFGDLSNFGVEFDGNTFASVAPPGQWIVNTTDHTGWYVQSVTLDGKDVTDRPFDLQADVTSLLVTYSDKHPTVSGTVKDARGEASATAAVLAFPADPARWSGYGTESRTMTSMLVSRAGAYTLDSLPAGDHFLIAVDAAETDDWMDPQKLERLARQATRVTLTASDSKTVDLTLKVIR